MAKGSKYTEDMVAQIEMLATEHQGLDLQLCTELADTEMFANAGITARGIVAKARTLGLPYRRVVRTAKDGSSVVRKDELVTLIESATGLTDLDDLSKAGKQTLRRLVDHLVVIAD